MALPAASAGSGRRRQLAKVLPILDWSRGYRRSWLPRDLLGGVLGALAAIPAAMGFARVAGLAPHVGLYTLVLPVLAYAVFGTSRRMVIAPSGVVAALVAEILLPLAATGTARHLQLLALLGLMSGALFLLAAALRLGLLETFVSRPVLHGYLAGSALVVALTQVGPMIGARSEGRTALAALGDLAENTGTVTAGRAAFGLGALLVLVLLSRVRLPIPAAALVLVGGALLVRLAGWSQSLELVGAVGRSLPPIRVPAFDASAMWSMFPGALGIAAVIFFNSAAIARARAAEHGEHVPPNQELFALGMTNLATGIGGGFPVGGSAPDTAIGERSGAKTPLAAVVSALVVIAALFSGWLFERIPVAALSAVVLVTVLESVAWKMFPRLWRFDRRELAFFLVALSAVLALGFARGLLAAVAVNIAMLLRSATRPRLVELGRRPEAPESFEDLERSSGLQPVPGVLLLRLESALFFVNATLVGEEILRRCGKLARPLRAVVLDLGTTPQVDFTGCLMLEELRQELAGKGIALAVANPLDRVREALERFGLQSLLPDGAGDLGRVIERLGRGGVPEG